jgi:hypothetical protein
VLTSTLISLDTEKLIAPLLPLFLDLRFTLFGQPHNLLTHGKHDWYSSFSELTLLTQPKHNISSVWYYPCYPPPDPEYNSDQQKDISMLFPVGIACSGFTITHQAIVLSTSSA